MPSTSQSLLDYLRTVVDSWRDDPRDDATLLARFAEGGDETAFRVLVGRHGPMVWRTCRHILGDTPDAEDAFQTTFLALARKASRLPVKTLAGWLYKVARRASLDSDARARRLRNLEHQLHTAMHPKVEGNAGRAELYTALDEELASLPERLRVPLVLRYLESKTLEEVARIVGCSRRDLGRRLAKGEALLRLRLERRGLEVGSVVSVGVLLGSTAEAPAVPARLIGGTARAAVAFRAGTLTGEAAEAAWAVVRSLPLEGTVMRKIVWMMLACVGLLGTGLAAWQTPAGHSDEVESAAPESSRRAAEPGTGQVDRFGDPLPTGALARLGTLRLSHVGIWDSMGGAGSVMFSPDGKVLITAGPGNPIRLWDAATGKLLRSFGDSLNWYGSMTVLSLSPDGNTLATRNDNGSVSFWDVATAKRLRQLGTNIEALAFSRDGRTFLSLCQDKQVNDSCHIRVWEVATGKEVRDQPLVDKAGCRQALMRKAGRPYPTAVFSPDGKTLASISEDANDNVIVHLWEVATGKEFRHLSRGKGWIPSSAVAFSPDSRFLAVSSLTMVVNDPSGGAVHLWEVATGKEVRKWTPDKAGTCSVAFSPDSKLLATGSGFGPIRLWDTATGKQLRQCQDYRAHVVALAFSPDGSMLASGAGKNDHTARLWEVASGKERLRTSRGHVGPVLSVSFSPDGKSLISGGRDGLVGFWNAETGQEQCPPLRAGDFQALAALSADGKTILTIGNSFTPNYQNAIEVVTQTPTQICVWDRATGQKVRQFPGPVGAAQSLALSPDGKILVLSFYNSVHVLDVATGKEIRRLTDQFATRSKCAALSPDGKTLAMGQRRWTKRKRGTEIKIENIVQFYATATGEEIGSIKDHKNDVSCLAFSPDGQTLAIGGQGRAGESKFGMAYTIRLWHIRADKRDWKESGTLVGHQGIIWASTFSPDGKTLASTSEDGTLRLWEIATGQERRRFAGHGGEVWCLAFAPDGRHLAAGGNDTTILVWDVTGRLQGGQLRPAKLSAHEVKGLWAELSDDNAVRAGQAVWTLAAAPAQAIPFLREHLRPVIPAGPRILARLIADLDSDNFAVRQKATDELAKLENVAKPALRQALAKSVSLEKRRRLEQLLEPLEEKLPSGEQLRTLRAMEVLGQVGTPEALQLLESLAQGAPEARRTREAQAVLECLRTRVNGTKR